MKTITINTHEATTENAQDVDRQHYTVAELIAELQNCDPEATVVIKNLNTGKFGSLDFQGITKNN